MPRLYFDQLRSGGTRYYFALDSSPGIVAPGVATLTLFGRQAAAAEPNTVFRTPTTATLTLAALQLASPGQLNPAQSTLTLAGAQGVLITTRIILVAPQPAVETPEIDYAPTLVTQMAVSPGRAQLTLLTLEQNVTQGGNIGFVSPGCATLTVLTAAGAITLGFQTGLPAALSLQGFAPSLIANSLITVSPNAAVLVSVGREPVLTLPFVWIDEDPVTPPTWIDEPRA